MSLSLQRPARMTKPSVQLLKVAFGNVSLVFLAANLKVFPRFPETAFIAICLCLISAATSSPVEDIDGEFFVKFGSQAQAAATCQPEDVGAIARDSESQSVLDCCRSCASMDTCQLAAYSHQQGLCLMYDQAAWASQCAQNGGWQIWGKSGASLSICQNGGQVQSDGISCQCFDGYVGNTCERLMEDCYEGKQSGNYPLMANDNAGQKVLWALPRLAQQPIQLTCLRTGYTLFQQRSSTTVSFNRTWQEYVDGFGNKKQNFWLGLQNLYVLTNSKQYHLGVYFNLLNETRLYLTFRDFRLTDNATYRVALGDLVEGDLGNHLQDMDGQLFSTVDNDNDNDAGRNCALDFGGGWWFNACAEVNFNGRLTNTGTREGVEDEVFYLGLGNTAPIHMSLRLVEPGT